eukprot:1254835-Amphidinium_carterae.1
MEAMTEKMATKLWVNEQMVSALEETLEESQTQLKALHTTVEKRMDKMMTNETMDEQLSQVREQLTTKLDVDVKKLAATIDS